MSSKDATARERTPHGFRPAEKRSDVECAACRCSECFATLVDRHRAVFANVLHRYERYGLGREDMRQEAAAALYVALPAWRPERCTFAAFAMTEARGAVGTLVRRAAAEKRGGDGHLTVARPFSLDMPLDGSGDAGAFGELVPASHADNDAFAVLWARERLNAARGALSTYQRTTLAQWWDGESMGCSAVAARSRLFQVRRRLREVGCAPELGAVA